MAVRVAVQDAELEVRDWGSGEPIIFVQTALTADELRPVAEQPALAAFRKILYHRRGYAGSSPAHGAGSITRDAADCRALLAAMAIERAHIVGVSYSGAVALQLAAEAPDRAHTLVLQEPPPLHTPSAAAFVAANLRLLRRRRAAGPAVALDEFLTVLIGPSWRYEMEGHLPGAVEQMERDAATFFDADLPALLAWRFSLADARRISCPVLHIGGTDSGRWFAEVREVVLSWLPHAEDVLIAGADHSLVLTHAAQVAAALADFLRRHPLPDPPAHGAPT